MPKLTGMPMRSAIAEVVNVPTMGTSAPNCSVTGFHSALIKKPKPNVRIEDKLPAKRETRIPASSANTRNAKSRVA